MNIKEYQKAARSTAVYPNIGENLTYPTLGLIGEFGELSEKLKKAIRDDNYEITETKRNDIIKEAGDIFWYISAICSELKIELQYNNFDSLKFIIDNYGIYDSILLLNNSINDVVSHCKEIIHGDDIHSRGFINHDIYGLIEELKRFLNKMNINMEQVLDTNIAKLLDRKNRNVLGGSGDNR